MCSTNFAKARAGGRQLLSILPTGYSFRRKAQSWFARHSSKGRGDHLAGEALHFYKSPHSIGHSRGCRVSPTGGDLRWPLTLAPAGFRGPPHATARAGERSLLDADLRELKQELWPDQKLTEAPEVPGTPNCAQA